MSENERLDKPLPPPIHDVNAPVPPSKGSGREPPQLPRLPMDGSLSSLHADLSPLSPMTPTSPNMPDGKKKTNPLTDLIDTEKAYVDLLTAIIRKVAAAWSRSNLPPPQLDTMFRAIESIYKANRSLLSRLKEIGTSPSSPKALGDLLMRWIEDLETPYENYAAKFCTGFDQWDPVTTNTKLPNIISTLSSAIPPPSAIESGVWSLDDLFILPKARLKYYRKLYSRLLKSTSPGRNDYKLLVAAVEKLDFIMDTIDSRVSILVDGTSRSAKSDLPEDEVVIDLRTQSVIGPGNNLAPLPPPKRGSDFESESSSARGSSWNSETQRSSSGTSWTPNDNSRRGSSNTMSSPISDLEQRLATERTLDIFTMKPKVVRLQMLPPSLTFKRELRCSVDVVIRFTPRATGQEWVHHRGHVLLLSDLFLVCERMTSQERADGGPEGPDMWLCYPPLAGKVLRVNESQTQENVLEVAIMRKETLFLQSDSAQTHNFLLREFQECIDFAGTLPPPTKELPPPVPPMPGSQSSSRNSDPSQSVRSPSNSPHSSLSASSPPPNNFHASASSPPGPMRPVGPGEVMPPTRSASFNPFPAQPQRTPGGPPLRAPQPQPFGVGPGFHHAPPRPPSEPGQPTLRNSPSTRSLNLPQDKPMSAPLPPMPNYGPGGFPPGQGPPAGVGDRFPPGQQGNFPPNRPPPGGFPPPNGYGPGPGNYPPPGPNYQQPGANDWNNLPAPQPRPLLPSMQTPGARAVSMVDQFDAPSPPGSPVQETARHTGPITTTVSAQMKCKVFLKQHHAQWKNLGAARLKLYRQDPTNIKQLVVEADTRSKSVLISTIILTDGVERVGKTGVAIELSDKGARTGIVYMIQLRNETSTLGLFDSLIAGSDRTR